VTCKCSKWKVVSQGVLRKYREKHKANIGAGNALRFFRDLNGSCMVIAIPDSGHLGYDPASLGKWLPTFGRNMSSSPSGVYARLEGTRVLRHTGNQIPRDATPRLQQTGMFVYFRENIETRSGSPVFPKKAHNFGPYVQLIIGLYVVIVRRPRTGRSGGSDPCMEKRLFYSPNHPDWLQGPPINPTQWLSVFSPLGGKWPGREVIHSASS